MKVDPLAQSVRMRRAEDPAVGTDQRIIYQEVAMQHQDQLRQQIQEHMPVVCSNHQQFATVDRVEGDMIKLTKDDQGDHHWIPLDWVESVDHQVHMDRPSQQAMQEWRSSPPAGAAGQGDERTQETMPGI